MSISEALDVFMPLEISDDVFKTPSLKSLPVHHLDVSDSFFDSLRNDYPEFNDWFAKISREGRNSWVHLEDGKIKALLIYKVEDEGIPSNPPLACKRRLKLCLFKVAITGNKLGDLFIKLAVQLCVRNTIDEMYLTHFTEPDDYLVYLISEFGFHKVAEKPLGERDEDVFLKKLRVNQDDVSTLNPVDISRIYYPSFYDGAEVTKWIIPILPGYHLRLFTDYGTRQTLLTEFEGEYITEGNTITKAYPSHANVTSIKNGDLVFFYRSQDEQQLTSLGVVEAVHLGQDNPDTVIQIIGKRSVFKISEIIEIVKKSTLVVLFKWICHLQKPITLNELMTRRILSSAPSTIRKISDDSYVELKEATEIDESYTIDKT